jgi:hypothetical protein
MKTDLSPITLRSWLDTGNLLIKIRRQGQYLDRAIMPLVRPFAGERGTNLTPKQVHKIRNYYGLGVPAMLGEAICALRGSSMTAHERMASSCQGGMTGIFDDFFDEEGLTDQQVLELIEKTELPADSPASHRLFVSFHNLAKKHMAVPERMRAYWPGVFDGQAASRRQEGPPLTVHELREIMQLKGGTSLRFFRSAFGPCSEAEDRFLYALGGMVQFTNDIFDVYKDREAGVQTMVTTTSHISALREELLKTLLSMYQAFRASGINRGRLIACTRILSMGTFCRAMVCLEQLEKTEGSHGGLFNPAACTRKELICDMELWPNRFQALRYHHFLVNLLTD